MHIDFTYVCLYVVTHILIGYPLCFLRIPVIKPLHSINMERPLIHLDIYLFRTLGTLKQDKILVVVSCTLHPISIKNEIIVSE